MTRIIPAVFNMSGGRNLSAVVKVVAVTIAYVMYLNIKMFIVGILVAISLGLLCAMIIRPEFPEFYNERVKPLHCLGGMLFLSVVVIVAAGFVQGFAFLIFSFLSYISVNYAISRQSSAGG